MRAASIIFLGLGLLLSGACGDSDGDIAWNARFDGSETSGNSTGGATVGARGTFQTLPADAWIFEPPAPFPGGAPPADLDALGRALLVAGADLDVLDAIETPRGLVALLRDPAGDVKLALFAPGVERSGAAPGEAEGLVLAGEDPLRVRVVLADGLATLATYID